MSMVSSAGDDEVMAEINITPFTDVLLVLLIIFMILAALVTPPGFQKQLPDSNPSNNVVQHHKTNDIEVLVDAKGDIFVDAKKATDRTIYRDMYDAMKHKGAATHVSLTADVKAPYGIIIRILDAAKDAGLNDVGFVTS